MPVNIPRGTVIIDVKEWGIMGKNREINCSWGHHGHTVELEGYKQGFVQTGLG